MLKKSEAFTLCVRMYEKCVNFCSVRNHRKWELKYSMGTMHYPCNSQLWIIVWILLFRFAKEYNRIKVTRYTNDVCKLFILVDASNAYLLL